MSGNSLDITHTLVTTTTQSINVSSLCISDLTGIQYFSSLNYLDCSGTSLTNLPPLPNTIQTLWCCCMYFTSLTSLPALPNSLKYLDCHTNSITTLPPLPSSLLSVDCHSNSITSLPTLPVSLTFLDCQFNSIKCFPNFPNSITNIFLNPNPFNCLPNYVLPAMNNYTTTPICSAGNSNGCPFITGTEKLNENTTQISIYPNPTNSQIFIEQQNIEEIIMLNCFGQKINVINNPLTKQVIDFSSLTNGIYFLQLRSVSSQRVFKIVKE